MNQADVKGAVTTIGWTLGQWQNAYQHDGLAPAVILEQLRAALSLDDTAWITIASPQQLSEQLHALAALLQQHQGNKAALPLYGVPFAVKDNIDAAEWPTTAGCKAGIYIAAEDAHVVMKLHAAGAILIGKVNLDQFATGLVGTRSPFGEVPNSFNPDYVSGGSSSGSASVVARGLVPFALGTDTAGSGRVPAAFNNVVGLKPTKGWVSNRGLIPACRTQDCISVMALTVDDATVVTDLMSGEDSGDAYSRTRPTDAPASMPDTPTFAIPSELDFLGDKDAEENFNKALSQLKKTGVVITTMDFAPFRELAALLYQGPWVAERYVSMENMLKTHPEAVYPAVREIVMQATQYSAADAFAAEYRRVALAKTINKMLDAVDAMVVPSTPTIYTRAQISADPIALNSTLGMYTNFTNLADLSALALPAGLRADGLPAGITLIAPAWHDWKLADFGRRWQSVQTIPAGVPSLGRTLSPDAATLPKSIQQQGEVVVAVVGAHLRGMPLNHQLTSRRARFLQETKTAPAYRLYALSGTTPPKPGLKRVADDGAEIVVELWAMSAAAFGSFVQEVPQPMGIGNVMLEDGREVKGFICEQVAMDGATDITHFGGWRAYLESLA